MLSEEVGGNGAAEEVISGVSMFPSSLAVAKGGTALCSGQVLFIRQHKQPWEPAGSLAEPVQTGGCKGTSSGADNSVVSNQSLQGEEMGAI